MNNCFVNLYKGMVEERAKKMAQKYDGQFCILTNGEKLKNVKSGAEIAFYSPAQKSYECNGGAYIFNLGNGISILTCSDEFAQEMIPLFKDATRGVWVWCYNNGVVLDTDDEKIRKMALRCGKPL